jgi:hypothetical protein
MSDIQPYAPGALSTTRDLRRAGRAVSRHRADGQIAVCGVDTITDITGAKIDSGTAVIGQAMGAVVRVAQAQKHLEQLAPEATGRLSLLADSHAVLVLVLLALVSILLLGLLVALVQLQRRQLDALVSVLGTEQRIDELTRRTIAQMRAVAVGQTGRQ